MPEPTRIPVKIVEKSADFTPPPIIDKPIEEKAVKKPKSRFWLVFKLFVFFILFSIVALVAFSSQIPISSQNSNLLSKFSFINQIKNLAESADKKLKGEADDRINIILLGMGGKGHDGAYLTDTIILSSLQPSTKKVGMVSIPRDLSVPIEGYGWRKVNNINAFAEMQKEGSGGLAVSQALGDLIEVPIDYYVRVDFTGFMNIINKLDGVDVYVENNLDDYSYPVLGREDAYPYSSRYEHLHVEKGWQHMDGSLALKYARSRHGYGVEGSDFARARRQQKVIEAVKTKLLSMNTLFRPTLITDIINELQTHISTNLSVWEIVKLWSMFKDTKSENIINKVLDNGPDGLLVNDKSADGAYILMPKSGDFKEVQYLIKNIFSEASAADKDKIAEEAPTIAVLNGTWINGLAAQTAMDLERFGFRVVYVGNSSNKNFSTSTVYDLSNGEKPKSADILKVKTGAETFYGAPEWLNSDLEKINEYHKNQESLKPNFVFIIGREKDKTNSGMENQDK
jgi:polyisoprenyl-teichoic acid--peptidoglycan teichoic acid transferase